ncbi:MAG: electron transfer flavoprotein subunit alpha/FixB family protein [Calditrichota bacterium]
MSFLVFIESRNGKVRGAGIEALSAACKLADRITGEVNALLIGRGVSDLIPQVESFGADRILLADYPELEHYSPEGWREAILTAVKQHGASIVVMTSTILGRDLAPMIAARLEAAFLPDCTALEYTEGRIIVRRPVYAGRCIMTLAATGTPVVISLRPKAFPAVPRDDSKPVVEKLELDLTGKIRARAVETIFESGGKLEVTEADVIVAGGRGLKSEENFKLLEDLASPLNAAVGVSRAVVDAGWRPHSEQIGQTGKVVSPTLYIAAGISGAIQHLAGMRTSKVIVAINKDPEAPIFKSADYGIVGDAMEILPVLTQRIRELN